MKTFRSIVPAALSLAASVPALAGPLVPPAGPVAPTFKTLAEVQPRIAINSTNTPGDATCSFKITQPGSYYLTGNVTGASGKHGIIIASGGVTLDLGGFAMTGVAGSIDGVAVSGSFRNVKVSNGSVQSWGRDGVNTWNATSSIVESIAASDNSGYGIIAGERARVADCVTRTNSNDNIAVGGFSQVTGCIADASAAGHGINASFVSSIVKGCSASGNARSGIRAAQRTLVQDCLCASNSLHGVHITWIGVVENCYLTDNTGDGILMDDGGGVTIRNNTVLGLGNNVGIRVANAGACHLEGNFVTFCQTGMVVATSNSTVIRNSAIYNANHYSVAPGNLFAPPVTPATASTATNPLANYSN